MDDIKMVVNEISCMEDTLITAVKAQLAKGIEQADTRELGEAIDMIKDLADAKKNCQEAHYYKTVTEAMKEDPEEADPRYGYSDRMRKPIPRYYKPYIDQEPYVKEYLERQDVEFANDRMGYSDGMPKNSRGEISRETSGDRYGRAYRNFQSARRHYTETNSPMDKDAMTTHATEHVADTIATIREIWRTADPDLKKRMKTDFTNLLGEMTV